MLNVYFSKRYKKSFKILLKSGRFDKEKVKLAVSNLANGVNLDPKYRDHQLVGPLSKYRECHIESDLLIIYEIDIDENYLEIVNIGTHSELFG
jgi:mRNA interferase YafQ